MIDYKKHTVMPKRSFAGSKKQYIDFMTEEDHVQHQVVQYIRYAYPKLKFHHSPDYGRRTHFEQFKYEYLGAAGGFPDLLIFSERKILCIELKVKPNSPTIFQKEWIKFLNTCAVRAVVCYSFEEAKRVIQETFEPVKKITEI